MRHNLLQHGLISADYILDSLLRKRKKTAVKVYPDFMTTYGDKAYDSGIRGIIFERVVLELLPQGTICT